MDTNTRPNEQANSHAPVAAAAIAAAGAPSSTEEANIPGIREQILGMSVYPAPLFLTLPTSRMEISSDR